MLLLGGTSCAPRRFQRQRESEMSRDLFTKNTTDCENDKSWEKERREV